MPDTAKPLSEEERKYYCGDSTCCNGEPKHTIFWMIRNVPGWAANRIQYGEKQEATIRALQAEKALHDANNRIMIAEAKTERLKEKLEAIASVPFEPFSSAIAKAAIAETERESDGR